MSEETTPHKRRTLDNYQTPVRLADAITRRVLSVIKEHDGHTGFGEGSFLLEPSAGVGRFVTALRTEVPSAFIAAVEPRKVAVARIQGASAIFTRTLEQHVASNQYRSIDLALGNPPFSRAQEHVELLKPRCHWVAFLLRLSFLGSQHRASTLWKAPNSLRYIIPVAERPSFIKKRSEKTGKLKDTTDNGEYAIFMWRRGHLGLAEVLPHLFWKEES